MLTRLKAMNLYLEKSINLIYFTLFVVCIYNFRAVINNILYPNFPSIRVYEEKMHLDVEELRYLTTDELFEKHLIH